MAKVIMTIAPEDDMCFDNIMSFKTESYIGLWNNVADRFMLMNRSIYNGYFEPYILEENYENLRDLDEAVYELVDEHITEVFDHSNYKIELD